VSKIKITELKKKRKLVVIENVGMWEIRLRIKNDLKLTAKDFPSCGGKL